MNEVLYVEGCFVYRGEFIHPHCRPDSPALNIGDFFMANSKFATPLRISKMIPMVLPQYKREAILALCAELKKALGS